MVPVRVPDTFAFFIHLSILLCLGDVLRLLEELSRFVSPRCFDFLDPLQSP